MSSLNNEYLWLNPWIITYRDRLGNLNRHAYDFIDKSEALLFAADFGGVVMRRHEFDRVVSAALIGGAA